MPDTVVGRVFVEDPDDWDLPDKTFSWLEGEEYRHFELDTDTGNITMKYGTPNGSYPLKFQVRPRIQAHGCEELKPDIDVGVDELYNVLHLISVTAAFV